MSEQQPKPENPWLRIIACCEACAGMADPKAEIQAMRDELADIRQRLKGHADSKLDGENGLAAATMRGFDALQSENEAIREAIKEAIDSLHKCSRVIGAPKTYEWADEDVCDAAYNSAQNVLTKLQPFNETPKLEF